MLPNLPLNGLSPDILYRTYSSSSTPSLSHLSFANNNHCNWNRNQKISWLASSAHSALTVSYTRWKACDKRYVTKQALAYYVILSEIRTNSLN